MGEIEVYASELAELARKEPGKYKDKKYRAIEGRLITMDGTRIIDEFIVSDDGCLAFGKLRLYFANNTQVEEIKQPVIFMEAVNSGKKLKHSDWGEYYCLNRAMEILGNMTVQHALNEINGKWYIED